METSALIAMFKKVSQLDILPAFYPNTALDSNGNSKPTGDHFKVDVINSEPQVLSVCNGKSRYNWILQVNVFCKDGEGIIKATNYAQQLKDGIPFNTILTENGYSFKTMTAGNIVPYLQTDYGWVIVPVQFRVTTIN